MSILLGMNCQYFFPTCVNPELRNWTYPVHLWHDFMCCKYEILIASITNNTATYLITKNNMLLLTLDTGISL